jgi:hypothetical protein
MTTMSVLDAAGRRRSPATMPGYHAGRPPRNKGIRYPADPPTVEEIVAVMRHAPDDRHGWRVRAMIVVLWRAGLRIQEALALAEHDLDVRRGSVLVRSGKGGRRREVGMDDWGWEQVGPWLTARAELGRAAVLHHRWPHAWTAVVGRSRPLRIPSAGRRGRDQAQVRAASAAPRARARARARGRAAEHHPAPARAYQPRHHVDLTPGDRSGGDHHGRAHAPGADDLRQRRAAALIDGNRRDERERPRAPASSGRSSRLHASRDARVDRPLRASWRLTPTRSFPTRSGSDGRLGVAPPPRMEGSSEALAAPVPQLRYGRRRRGPARPARRPAACNSSVDPAHLGGAISVVGRDPALVGRSRGGGGQRRRGRIGHLIGANSTAPRSSGGAVGAARLCPRGR